MVTWDLARFRRAKVVGVSGNLIELHLTGGGDPRDATEAFRHAVDEANEVLAEAESSGKELYVLVTGVTLGPNGPVGMFKECEPLAALRLYLATLSAGLESRGVSGELAAVAPQDRGRWWGRTFGALTASLSLSIDRDAAMATYDTYGHQPDQRWWVSDAETQRTLGPLIDWVLAAGDQVVVSHGGLGMNVDPAEAKHLALDGLAKGHFVAVAASPGPGVLRQVNTRQFGDVCVRLYHPEQPRTEQLSELVGLLTLLAPDLRTGWIQESKTTTISRYSLLTETPPEHPWLQRVGGSSWWLFDLEENHVFDAYVAQVLTDGQLALTRDLSAERWDVRALDRGRHLVVSRQPEAWLRMDVTPPDDDLARSVSGLRPALAVPPAVLEQARADFGDAIMTLETLREHPFVEPGTGETWPR
jgi:hypothetical protein